MPFIKGHTINIGRKFSVERNRKLSESNKGKHPTEETKKKMSMEIKIMKNNCCKKCKSIIRVHGVKLVVCKVGACECHKQLVK